VGPLAELLATDHRRILEFFVSGLREVSEPNVDRQELFYNASVLAHYAPVSTQAGCACTSSGWTRTSNPPVNRNVRARDRERPGAIKCLKRQDFAPIRRSPEQSVDRGHNR
jgi:hypothetical protein